VKQVRRHRFGYNRGRRPANPVTLDTLADTTLLRAMLEESEDPPPQQPLAFVSRRQDRASQPAVAVLTRRATPFVRVPRLLPFVRGHVWRERLCTFLIFSLVPTVFWWTYLLLAVWNHLPQRYIDLRVAMPISSLWVTFGPLLMQQGEFSLERLISAFNKDGPSAGWNFNDIQRSINSSDRAFYWFAWPVAIISGAAILTAYPALSTVIPLDPYTRFTGVFDLFVLGFVSGAGAWGVLMAISIVRNATRRANIPWNPFRSERPASVVEIYRFVWSVAIIFSFGSVFLPLIIVLRQRIALSLLPEVLVIIGMTLLFVGGLLLYSVPVFMLYQMAQRQRDSALNVFAPLIEEAMSNVRSPEKRQAMSVVKEYFSLKATLDLRQAVASENPAPVFNVVARAASTLVLPTILTLIQVGVAFVK
jgi:hypothetical protein